MRHPSTLISPYSIWNPWHPRIQNFWIPILIWLSLDALSSPVQRQCHDCETLSLSGNITEDYQTNSLVVEDFHRNGASDRLTPLSTLESPVSDCLHSPDDFANVPPLGPSCSVSSTSKKPSAVSYNAAYNISSIVPLTSVACSWEVGGDGFIIQIGEDGTDIDKDLHGISNKPSLNFSRKIWWDSLLSLYISSARHGYAGMGTGRV